MTRATIFDYLNRPEERPFLVPALDRTLTDEERERYAACLEADDPARAEWLRLERALHSRAAADGATRRRFDALCEVLTADWVRLLSRDTVLNCGQARGEPRRVRFAFVCERRWESLAPTAEPGVRACDSCEERVHHCASAREAEAHARDGHCIAVPRALVTTLDGRDTRHILGRPDPIGDWAARIFDDE